MKLRDYKKHTFRVCMAWVANPSVRNTDRLVNNLRRWARGEGDPYNYNDTTTASSVEYCSDRVNPGRWRVCDEAGVAGRCGNHDQHQLREGHGLEPGAYQKSNCRWRKIA